MARFDLTRLSDEEFREIVTAVTAEIDRRFAVPADAVTIVDLPELIEPTLLD